jgi:hypothetical protein
MAEKPEERQGDTRKGKGPSSFNLKHPVADDTLQTLFREFLRNGDTAVGDRAACANFLAASPYRLRVDQDVTVDRVEDRLELMEHFLKMFKPWSARVPESPAVWAAFLVAPFEMIEKICCYEPQRLFHFHGLGEERKLPYILSICKSNTACKASGSAFY